MIGGVGVRGGESVNNGRVRREVEGARASAQQAEADFENTRLILMATLASTYYSLREVDAEMDVVRRSLDLQRDALKFVSSRHDLGFATGLDLAQQEALLDSSATQLELLQNQRNQLEHAPLGHPHGNVAESAARAVTSE